MTQAAQAQTCTPDWEIVTSPNVAGSNVLTSVTVIAENDAWAVGYAYTGNHADTLTLHWDGVSWTIVPSPSPGSQNVLLGVSGSAADDVWAVGYVVGPSSTLIEHWDGRQWIVVPSPSSALFPSLNAVVALARDDAWAVGQMGVSEFSDPLFVHWDGQSWTVAPSPPHAAGRFAITAVSTSDIWASGRSLLPDNSALFTHWNGVSWTVVPNPPLGDSVSMTGMTAVGSNDVWAVGGAQGSACDDTCTYWEYGVVQRWDGGTWRAAERPPFHANIRAATAQAQSIWVTGFDPTNGQDVSRWDGLRWTGVTGLRTFTSLASTPAGNVWAVGNIRAGNFHTLTVRYFCR